MCNLHNSVSIPPSQAREKGKHKFRKSQNQEESPALNILMKSPLGNKLGMIWSCEQCRPTQHPLNSRRTLPCPAGGCSFYPQLLPSAVQSSQGRLSADPGRQQSPCPSTQPPGVQGPCSEGQPSAPLAARPASQPCSHPQQKAAVMPCPSDAAAGKPCSAACPPPLQWRNSESPPDRSHKLPDVPVLGDPSRN